MAVAMRGAVALPPWRTPSSHMPTMRDCTLGADSPEARLNAKLSLRVTTDMVVRWVRPNCAVGGTEVRVDAFLLEYNKGELGLGERGCSAGTVDLRQPLNDTWAVFWFLLYPGTYTLCHRPLEGRGRWREQARIHLVEPTPQHCSQVRNASSVHGHVRCEFPQGEMQTFFDGFVNEPTEKPHRCTFDCAECLAEGGTCTCFKSGKAALDTCAACQGCPEWARSSGLCQCKR